MNYIDSYTTTVRMLPVCECGQVISDLVLDMYIDVAESGYKYSNFTFTPGRCPNCGKYIEFSAQPGFRIILKLRILKRIR